MQAEQSSKRHEALGSGPVYGLIAKFAIPSVISMLINAAYNITDQIFIGNVVGMLGNGATNVAFPIGTFTVAFAQLVGIGTAANFNINIGAKKEEEAKRYLGSGLCLMGLFAAAIFLLVASFQTPILLLCGATENVLPLAQEYLSVTCFGLPLLLFMTAGAPLIRADGSPTYSMICTVSGALLNVFLDWLFMFRFHWGIRGAALATVIGQAVSALLCLLYYFRFKTFSIHWSMLRLRWSYVKSIAKLGTSNFINHIIMMLVNIVLNNSLSHYGAMTVYGKDIPLAVSGVLAKVNSISAAFTVGLAHGCQPLLGYNTGARNYGRIKEIYKKAAGMALLVSFTVFVILQTFPRQITAVFGDGSELYFAFAQRYLRIYLLMLWVNGIQPLTVNYFTSTGNVSQGIVLSLSRQGFLLLPLLLILPRFWGLDGVLYAGPTADFLAFMLSLTMVWLSFRRLDRLQAEMDKTGEN